MDYITVVNIFYSTENSADEICRIAMDPEDETIKKHREKKCLRFCILPSRAYAVKEFTTCAEVEAQV